MKSHISASDLVRRLSDVLGRVQYGGESFVVERHGAAVARISPVPGATATLRDAIGAWRSAATADDTFADDLERVSRADKPPSNPWA